MEVKWTVSTLERITNTGYVYKAGCRCDASETVDNKKVYGTTLISAKFTGEIGPDFIPFENLTEQEVLSWVFTEIGDELKLKKEQVAEAKLNQAIAALTPTTEEGVPWTPQ